MERLVDSYQRTITYLRLSLTDRCNLRCQYCMPPEGLDWIPADNLMQDDEIVTILRDVFLPLGVTKVRLTGGEPTLRKGLPALVERIAALPGLTDLSMTTNGIFLSKLAGPLAQAGLKRINISVDSLDPERFGSITRGGDLSKVLKGIEASLAAGLSPVKLNAVLIPGTNDDEVLAFAALTREMPVHVRFIEMMQVGDRSFFEEKGFVPIQAMIDQIRDRYGIEASDAAVEGNGPAKVMRIPGAAGTLGFISPMSQNFCHACNRLRLTADGQIKACLMRPQEQDLLGQLRAGTDPAILRETVRNALGIKPLHHEWGADEPILRTMSRIGG
ncbi:GTP 3',8-cyclase MoaA [bacterium]|nr:GTP 3',8-cyclase MoaA [bacterium]